MIELLPLLAAGGKTLDVPIWAVIPFALTLLGIAIIPLVAHHWWESNRNRAMFAWIIAIPTAIWWITTYGKDGQSKMIHEWQAYISFILLLGSLYVASGGIYLRANLKTSATTNTAICAIGAIIANIVGTTGASMLLIRPYMKANANRSMFSRILSVVFFIFMVSNIGGCLTPLGDPPLFLGFLKGVPFGWTLRLWVEWAMAIGILLVIFHVWDRILLKREGNVEAAIDEEALAKGFGVEGKVNLLLLFGVIGAVLGQGHYKWEFGVQEGIMAAMTIASLVVTSKAIRKKNHFTWGPIAEVAILFSGIFTVMVPTLEILSANGSKMGLTEPWHYFWVTGGLSAFLDNAPTYVVFGQTALAQLNFDPGVPSPFAQLSDTAVGIRLLVPISLGAVFMGAMSYIGNGPNFMVKAIAEENGIKMPSFFGYMKYSVCILLPIFALITWIFLV